MRNFASYDAFESMRQGGQWVGATAKAFWSNPAFGLASNPVPATLAAWGEVTERAFDRMVTKPDWDIDSVVTDGREYVVNIETFDEKPFCRLLRFRVDRPAGNNRKILLVAPMSGHYATLLRKTVISLLPNCDVYITEWKNARDIPVSDGSFDVEDFTKYLVDFMKKLGGTTNVIAVCQPAPLALAATAWLAEHSPANQPRTLTLIGGPIDPEAHENDVTRFGRSVSMRNLESSVIQTVGTRYRGFGRQVYPGVVQLASFMSMNAASHSDSFFNQILNVAKGEATDHDRHNSFYDEYLAAMDMTAEFFLTTVDRIFKKRQIATNTFTLNGQPVDIGKITKTAVKCVEGLDDDITAPGQCLAALALLTGLDDSMKASHQEPGAGHYGIFSGKAWREDIRPLVLGFIDEYAVARPEAVPTTSKIDKI